MKAGRQETALNVGHTASNTTFIAASDCRTLEQRTLGEIALDMKVKSTAVEFDMIVMHVMRSKTKFRRQLDMYTFQ